MPRPVCVQCQKFLRCKKIGVDIEERMPDNGAWIPYKLWHADLWHCPHCGYEIVMGYGQGPIRERHHADYDQWRARLNLVAVVEDC